MAVNEGENNKAGEPLENGASNDEKVNLEQQRDSLRHMLERPLNKGETW